MTKISVVIPCYFNEDNIPVTTSVLIQNEALFDSEVEFEYVFIDDGSEDETFFKLKKFKKQHGNKIIIIKLASNVGSYNAIYAGLKHATGDCIVVMAADLQDPPELILDMYCRWLQGNKIILANRIGDIGWFTRVYYWSLRTFCLPDLPHGGFDYCLFDNEVKQRLLAKTHPNINSLYLLLTFGYPHKTIPYQKRMREIGLSKWTFRKRLKLAHATFFFFSFSNRGVMAYFWKTSTHKPYVIEEVL